jgi:hypothetical protein
MLARVSHRPPLVRLARRHAIVTREYQITAELARR